MKTLFFYGILGFSYIFQCFSIKVSHSPIESTGQWPRLRNSKTSVASGSTTFASWRSSGRILGCSSEPQALEESATDDCPSRLKSFAKVPMLYEEWQKYEYMGGTPEMGVPLIHPFWSDYPLYTINFGVPPFMGTSVSSINCLYLCCKKYTIYNIICVSFLKIHISYTVCCCLCVFLAGKHTSRQRIFTLNNACVYLLHIHMFV